MNARRFSKNTSWDNFKWEINMEIYLYSTVPTLFGDRPAPLEVHLVGHEYVGAALAAVLAGEVLQRLARLLE